MDEKLGRMVTRIVLPRVVMHSRYHYGVLDCFLILLTIFFAYPKSVCMRSCPLNLPDVCDLEFPLSREALSLMDIHWQAFSDNFTGLELEDGGGRGTSGCLSFSVIFYF